MHATTGTASFSDITRLFVVLLVLGLVGTGCGKKREDQSADMVDPNAPVAIPSPAPPEPVAEIPPTAVNSANSKFGNLANTLQGCSSSLQSYGPLTSYLSSLFHGWAGGYGNGGGYTTAYGTPLGGMGSAYGYGFTAPQDGKDRGVAPGSRGAFCLSSLGNSILGLAGLTGSGGYSTAGVGGYIQQAIQWIFQRLGRGGSHSYFAVEAGVGEGG